MRAGFKELIPLAVKRSLTKFGRDIRTARRKRRLSVEMMLERTGLSKATYSRVEKGDESTSIGAYAMCLFALGHGSSFGNLLDQSSDQTGLLLDTERLPKRIRASAKKETD